METDYRKDSLLGYSQHAIRVLLIAGVILMGGCGDTSGESDSGDTDSTDELKAAKWGESNWDESEWE